MWASYAKEHTGVCLKINGMKLNERILEIFNDGYRVFKDFVEYSDNKFYAPPSWLVDVSHPINNLDQMVRDHIFQSYKYYFFLKAEDWETENEFRWIIQGEEDRPEYISIEDGTLEEVILGEDILSSDEDCIIKLCQESGVQYRKAEWTSGIPTLRRL